MSSECYELPVTNTSLINTTRLSSGASLIDMLNQQSYPTTRKDNSTPNTSIKDVKSSFKQTGNSESNEYDKLSTLFNTTGRERNSTDPLKQWLYKHQDHPYPKESDKQELMNQTKMSASQITIWFTNARVRMRKENILSLNFNGKKKKQQQHDLNHFDESMSSIDEISHLNIHPFKRIVMAYSCLNVKQITDIHYLVSLYSNQLSISDSVDDHTTHLIIGNEEKPLLCPLTKKLFQSISRHLYIITYRWIIECLKQNDIIDEIKYEIRGDIPFGEYHDGMRNSRLAKQIKLFQNCQFFILCDNCQDKMSKNELVSLIQLCHGSLLDTFPLTTIDNTILTIILCNKLLPFDCSNERKLFELSRSNGVYFLNPEWILESIVQFSLQPFDAYIETFC